MILYLHPRDEQRFRTAKPPTAGLMSFRCKCCHKAIFTMAGRKKHKDGGYKCSECAK